MSASMALTSLSKRFHYTPLGSLSSRPRDPSHPKLVLLFAWMGARLPHAQKYVNGYAAIWPSTPIILVQSLPNDFRPFSDQKKEYATLKTLLAQHEVDLTVEADGHETFLATMSNGGCWCLDTFVQTLPATAVLRPRTLLLDSCPGLARYSVTLKAFLIAGRYRLFSRVIATVVITIYYFVAKVYNRSTGRDPIGALRSMLIDRVQPQRRVYVYSKSDEVIFWKDVESHAKLAIEAGQQTKMDLFENSSHVMHVRQDEKRYWRIVQDLWNPRTTSKEVIAPEPSMAAVLPNEEPSAQTTIQADSSSSSSKTLSTALSLDTSITDPVEELTPSILGTKSYWDDIYKRERMNYEANKDDEGEIWFGEESEDKIVNYLEGNFIQDKPLSVLDLGTGNGHLLFKLVEEGFTEWEMLGIDYSQGSIELARSIATARQVKNVNFEVSDFLSETPDLLDARTFDLLLDKGTFDAISLSDEKTNDGLKLNEVYAKSVARLMKPHAKLVITSCNWTVEELTKKLTQDKILKVHAYFKKPKNTFSFGGQVGSTTSSVCFALA